MDFNVMATIVKRLNTIYINRGFITMGDVQVMLEEHDATLIETTRVMAKLEEAGCKISEGESTTDDLSFYDGSHQDKGTQVLKRFQVFITQEKIDNINDLEYSLVDYEIGVLYYIYLRTVMGLSKITAKKHIFYLQTAYNMFLDQGEDKVVFSATSAEFMQEVCTKLENKKVVRSQKKQYKEAMNAIRNYRYFLAQNRHQLIGKCQEILQL